MRYPYANRKPITKKALPLGTRVTCHAEVPTYHTGHIANDPQQYFRPGMVGTVASVDVPCVTYSYRERGGTASFVCVDFTLPDGRKDRVALHYNNIRIVRE